MHFDHNRAMTYGSNIGIPTMDEVESLACLIRKNGGVYRGRLDSLNHMRKKIVAEFTDDIMIDWVNWREFELKLRDDILGM